MKGHNMNQSNLRTLKKTGLTSDELKEDKGAPARLRQAGRTAEADALDAVRKQTSSAPAAWDRVEQEIDRSEG